MDEQHDVAGLNEDLAAEDIDLSAIAGRVLQLPVRLVREIGTIACDENAHAKCPPPLLVAVSEWALLYRNAFGNLIVCGFDDKDQLSACLTDVYRVSEIVAVLCKGKPVRFNMRVSARIG